MKSEKKALTDSKPVKRTTKSSTAAATATPKTASHRHSKLSVPVTPVEEVAVINVVAPTPHTTVAAPAPEPSPEEVARLAHAFWAERNFAHGFAEEDWFRAEKALAAAR